MNPEHGADLEGFIFAPMRDDIIQLKADEVHGILSAGISFGQIVAVRMIPIEGYDSSIRLQVFYRLSATSTVQVVERTITGLVTEETPL